MRTRRSATLLASAALFGVVTIAPAAPALAAGNPVTPPADCTGTQVNHYTSSLTCTSRPAGQQWQSYRDCTGALLDSGAYGNVVTGNGTSTAVCPQRAQAEQFVYFVQVSP